MRRATSYGPTSVVQEPVWHGTEALESGDWFGAGRFTHSNAAVFEIVGDYDNYLLSNFGKFFQAGSSRCIRSACASISTARGSSLRHSSVLM